jgi:hypothetical protein
VLSGDPPRESLLGSSVSVGAGAFSNAASSALRAAAPALVALLAVLAATLARHA